MNTLTKFLLTFTLCFVFASSALASPAESIKSSLLKARESLVTLLDTKDAPTQKKLEGEIEKASKEVDAGIKAGKADKATQKEAHAKYDAFKEIWDAFKKTRDSEIIPAIESGKVDAAKALAKGVQAERFGKLKELLAELGAK